MTQPALLVQQKEKDVQFQNVRIRRQSNGDFIGTVYFVYFCVINYNQWICFFNAACDQRNSKSLCKLFVF